MVVFSGKRTGWGGRVKGAGVTVGREGGRIMHMVGGGGGGARLILVEIRR